MTHHYDSTPANVADFLIRDIFAGHYQPGDFIPKEMAICEEFALSRTVVRRHLAQLVDGGIIERISGHGSRVREYADWKILDPQVTAWLTRFAAPNQQIQREILKFRVSVEPYVAMMAAQQAMPQDLAALEDALDGMGNHLRIEDDPEQRRLHSGFDVAFHVAVFRATHNIVWAQLSHILRPSISLLVAEANTSTTTPEHSLQRHRQLLDSIRRHQSEAAFRAAQAILQSTSDTLGLDYQCPDLPSLGR